MKTLQTIAVVLAVAFAISSCKVSFEGCYLTRFKDFPDTTIFPPERSNIPMYLNVMGDSVTGSWGNGTGTLSGTLSGKGKILTGTWTTTSAPIYSGKIWLTLAADGESFKGEWNGTTAPAPGNVITPLEWSGRRVNCDTLPVFTTLQKSIKK